MYMDINQEKLVRQADSESDNGRPTGEGKLVRQLKNRHIAMIRYAPVFLQQS